MYLGKCVSTNCSWFLLKDNRRNRQLVSIRDLALVLVLILVVVIKISSETDYFLPNFLEIFSVLKQAFRPSSRLQSQQCKYQSLQSSFSLGFALLRDINTYTKAGSSMAMIQSNEYHIAPDRTAAHKVKKKNLRFRLLVSSLAQFWALIKCFRVSPRENETKC